MRFHDPRDAQAWRALREMTMTCRDSAHWKACELHDLADCSTCHHCRGECDYGACHEPATTTADVLYLAGPRAGTVAQRRAACARHVTRMRAYGRT